MDEKNLHPHGQNIAVENREKVVFSGVKDIGAFTEEQVQLSTIKGTVVVKGTDLKVQKLDVDDGNVIITGMINSLAYTDKGEKKEKNLLGKIFK